MAAAFDAEGSLQELRTALAADDVALPDAWTAAPSTRPREAVTFTAPDGSTYHGLGRATITKIRKDLLRAIVYSAEEAAAASPPTHQRARRGDVAAQPPPRASAPQPAAKPVRKAAAPPRVKKKVEEVEEEEEEAEEEEEEEEEEDEPNADALLPGDWFYRGNDVNPSMGPFKLSAIRSFEDGFKRVGRWPVSVWKVGQTEADAVVITTLTANN